MSRSSNDDRSDSMNPNNDAYWDSLDNHERQTGDDGWEASDEDRGSGNEIQLSPRQVKGLLVEVETLSSDLSPLYAQCRRNIVDRTSHWLWIVNRLISRAWRHEYEPEKSQTARRMQIQNLERFASIPMNGDLSGKDADTHVLKNLHWYAREELAHAVYLEPYDNMFGPDPANLHFNRNRRVRTQPESCTFPDGSSMIVPDRIVESLSWRRMMQILFEDLSACMQTIDQASTAIQFTSSRDSQVRSPPQTDHPGYFTAIPHDSDESAMKWLSSFDGRKLGRGITNLDFAFMVSSRLTHTDITRGCLDSLECIIKWLSGFPDRWDIRHVLRQLIVVAAGAEWVDKPILVYGVKLNMISPSPQRSTDICGMAAEQYVSTTNEARNVADRFRRRGYRPIVLNLIPIIGENTWFTEEWLQFD